DHLFAELEGGERVREFTASLPHRDGTVWRSLRDDARAALDEAKGSPFDGDGSSIAERLDARLAHLTATADNREFFEALASGRAKSVLDALAEDGGNAGPHPAGNPAAQVGDRVFEGVDRALTDARAALRETGYT